MAELAAVGSPVAIVTSSGPDGWAELHALPVIQMVYTETPGRTFPARKTTHRSCGADVPDMLALAGRLSPAPSPGRPSTWKATAAGAQTASSSAWPVGACIRGTGPRSAPFAPPRSTRGEDCGLDRRLFS